MWSLFHDASSIMLKLSWMSLVEEAGKAVGDAESNAINPEVVIIVLLVHYNHKHGEICRGTEMMTL